MAYVGDALNHNNKVSSDDHGDIYKVTYRRWVDKPVGGRDDQDTPGTEHQQ